MEFITKYTLAERWKKVADENPEEVIVVIQYSACLLRNYLTTVSHCILGVSDELYDSIDDLVYNLSGLKVKPYGDAYVTPMSKDLLKFEMVKLKGVEFEIPVQQVETIIEYVKADTAMLSAIVLEELNGEGDYRLHAF